MEWKLKIVNSAVNTCDCEKAINLESFVLIPEGLSLCEFETEIKKEVALKLKEESLLQECDRNIHAEERVWEEKKKDIFLGSCAVCKTVFIEEKLLSKL